MTVKNIVFINKVILTYYTKNGNKKSKSLQEEIRVFPKVTLILTLTQSPTFSHEEFKLKCR